MVVRALVKNVCIFKHQGIYNLMWDVRALVHEGVYDVLGVVEDVFAWGLEKDVRDLKEEYVLKDGTINIHYIKIKVKIVLRLFHL